MSLIKTGWLCIYKPINISSSRTVLKIKKKFNLKKVGHAGTLDPQAKGILPIAFGSSTKMISFVINKRKKYHFIIKWGQQTTTDDGEGEIIFSSNKIPTQSEIKSSLKNFTGNIFQIPPKYSAIKYYGNRAYKLSRKNIKFNLQPREVSIFSLKFIKNINFCESLFEATVGPGFYIRSLARDLAIFLDTRGHISSLERLQVGIFNNNNTILLDDLLKISHLSSQLKFYYHSSVVLDDIPALTLNDKEVLSVRMGRKIQVSFLDNQIFKKLRSKEIVCAKQNNEVIAIGHIHDNFFKPVRVFC